MIQRTENTAEQRFCEGFLDAALWSSYDPDTELPLDDRYDWRDVDPDWLLEAIGDCIDFAAANMSTLDTVNAEYGTDYAQHGHDFWLTRNRHGAGFWDRGYGKAGDLLTAAAHAYGEMDLMPWDFACSIDEYA